MSVRTKRIYDNPESSGEIRILVDQLWPRGVSKEAAALDEWLKQVVPSEGLREWYDHDPDHWEEFRERYRAELDERDEPAGRLVEAADAGTLTLLYAATDREHNNAVVLKEYVAERTT